MAQPTEEAPLDTFWVREGRLMAGEYPGDREPQQARAKIRWLVDAGITAFVDLTEDGELLPYDHLLREAETPRQPIEHVRMPICDLNVPTEGEMIAILDRIDAKLDEGHTVFVHCWGGVGRTGTVVACFLVRHGLPADKAMDALKRLRQHSRKARREAPETSQQRRMVRGWTAER